MSWIILKKFWTSIVANHCLQYFAKCYPYPKLIIEVFFQYFLLVSKITNLYFWLLILSNFITVQMIAVLDLSSLLHSLKIIRSFAKKNYRSSFAKQLNIKFDRIKSKTTCHCNKCKSLKIQTLKPIIIRSWKWRLIFNPTFLSFKNMLQRVSDIRMLYER